MRNIFDLVVRLSMYNLQRQNFDDLLFFVGEIKK